MNTKSVLEKEGIDLEEFVTSKEYAALYTEFGGSNIYQILSGFCVSINADVEQIFISGRDEVKIIIVYSLKPDILSNEQREVIIVKDEELKKLVRAELKPNTSIKCTAKYSGSANGLVMYELIAMNNSLRFGHYICPECGYDYGRKMEGECCMCRGIKLECVTNFYE